MNDTHTPAHILVVEDDAEVGAVIELSLRANGFDVTRAVSGTEGLQAARTRLPDLIVLDVMMPGMDGYEVCRRIRADPRLAQLPVLFLTALPQREDMLAGLRAGADDYLTKPYDVAEFLLRVRALLRRRAAARSPGAEAAVHLYLLGAVRVERRGEQLHAFESQKALALLCYLALQDQPLSRSRLAGLFWGDKSEDRARGNLRRGISSVSSGVNCSRTMLVANWALNSGSKRW